MLQVEVSLMLEAMIFAVVGLLAGIIVAGLLVHFLP
jgi:hypothetical protein